MRHKSGSEAKPRCPRCRLHLELCVCGLAPEFDLSTKAVVIMHYAEERRKSNSGMLSRLVLKNSEIFLRGLRDGPAAPEPSEKYPNSLVLFPGAGSQELNDNFLATIPRPITLILADGNWNQAGHMVKREALMKDVPKVHLPLGEPTNYRLRKPQAQNRICTFEALSRALGIIEGLEIEQKLKEFFYLWVSRSLKMRGQPDEN
ncbi:DTW domain-containing protein [candidate division TA06 bacterium]|uniref:tRNA-uridine aminocarboxypropyltransferase n=1 Tax=candidate division TA06 bacterium TaxID=2250710 RepID=A0A933IBT4_UNCT6|nr:DTW domain-containing protein [candidate division TA06 bacterium]